MPIQISSLINFKKINIYLLTLISHIAVLCPACQLKKLMSRAATLKIIQSAADPNLVPKSENVNL